MWRKKRNFKPPTCLTSKLLKSYTHWSTTYLNLNHVHIHSPIPISFCQNISQTYLHKYMNMDQSSTNYRAMTLNSSIFSTSFFSYSQIQIKHINVTKIKSLNPLHYQLYSYIKHITNTSPLFPQYTNHHLTFLPVNLKLSYSKKIIITPIVLLNYFLVFSSITCIKWSHDLLSYTGFHSQILSRSIFVFY